VITFFRRWNGNEALKQDLLLLSVKIPMPLPETGFIGLFTTFLVAPAFSKKGFPLKQNWKTVYFRERTVGAI